MRKPSSEALIKLTGYVYMAAMICMLAYAGYLIIKIIL